jgi:tol-pal system protein YbgF
VGALFALLIVVPGPALAQSRAEAQLQLQIQQLQEQIRLLTGQVEGLQFTVTNLQSQMQTMSEDNEFRFQQLEGTSGAAPAAAPQAPAPVEPAPANNAALPDPQPLDLTGGGMGQSSDPLVGSNNMGTGSLGTLGGEDMTLGGNRPLDLNLDSGAAISTGDATAQYQAGYDAIVRGDYSFAEDQFQQFVGLYPDDPNAPDATNWLGEALMQRGAYEDAALVLAEGYERYKSTPRAPDLMLKLGVALAGVGEVETACRTFFTLQRLYPNQSAAFTQRVSEEKSRAQCPV